jgi:hypothetical protein
MTITVHWERLIDIIYIFIGVMALMTLIVIAWVIIDDTARIFKIQRGEPMKDQQARAYLRRKFHVTDDMIAIENGVWFILDADGVMHQRTHADLKRQMNAEYVAKRGKE